MSTLANTARNETISAALRDAFAPRFKELQDALEVRAAVWLAESHPEFCKAKKDAKLRSYLRITSTLPIHFTWKQETDNGVRTKVRGFRLPEYSATIRNLYHKCDCSTWSRVEGASTFDVKSLDVPEGSSLTVEQGDPMLEAYEALWHDYDAARDALHDTLYAYNVREKLEADFPNLTKYLPVRESKQRALAVPVDALQARLSKVGVPPVMQGA